MIKGTTTKWAAIINGYSDYGFRIELPGNDLVDLYFKDNKIDTFYQDTVTPDIIQERCENYLESMKFYFNE